MNRTLRTYQHLRATASITPLVMRQVIVSLYGNMLSPGSAVDLLPGLAAMTCGLSFGRVVPGLAPISAKRSLGGC